MEARSFHSKRGFTLIELLVVIAIIAILAAILFPVFATAKERARISTCAANEKQWATAVLMYMDNSDGRFPYAGAYAGRPHVANMLGVMKGSSTLYIAVKPYIRTEGIKWCPTFAAKVAKSAWGGFGWSYYYPCAHANEFTNSYAALCGYAMSDINKPSRKPLIIEVMDIHESRDNDAIYNLAYCDGRVRSAKLPRADSLGVGKIMYVGRDGRYHDPKTGVTYIVD